MVCGCLRFDWVTRSAEANPQRTTMGTTKRKETYSLIKFKTLKFARDKLTKAPQAELGYVKCINRITSRHTSHLSMASVVFFELRLV